MGVVLFPDKERVTNPDGKMTTRWLDWGRQQQRTSNVVLTGDESTTDATGDALALTVGGDTLRCNNATLLRIHGLVADATGLGHTIPIAAVGAGLVEIVPESGLAAASDRIITPGNVIVRLAPLYGRAWLEYDATSQRHRVMAFDQGAAVTPAFVAGDYTASAGTWTVASGDVATMTYYLRGRLLRVAFVLTSTSVSTTPASLAFVIPGGYKALRAEKNLVELVDNGARTTGVASVAASGSTVTIRRLDNANFTAAAAATSIAGQVEFEAAA